MNKNKSKQIHSLDWDLPVRLSVHGGYQTLFRVTLGLVKIF